MASVFTYDPDPPRVSSPWSTPKTSTPVPDACGDSPTSDKKPVAALGALKPALLAECGGLSKLQAEPQEGPTEYKLHLLLRQRRSFTVSTTSKLISGSLHGKGHHNGHYSSNNDGPYSESPRPSPMSVPSPATRQNRLQQLTTQLLWRLQQSSPYHSSSANRLVIPRLPEAKDRLDVPEQPSKLLPGLEESQGALYEIGVADDGTFVGLTQDELDESLENLKAMAASLGCGVKVLRTVIVGNCEWVDDNDLPAKHKEDLFVAEALVKPDFTSSHLAETQGNSDKERPNLARACSAPVNEESASQTEQLRVTLTGTTTSGKSSLLGTLSTSTLDNGRGKSRLSLLRHRHEIATGVTSSVSQEMLGYKTEEYATCTEVVNYASGNVSTWDDIHASSQRGRLVFLSDSAGHPRYRRTTARGLMSWAPHWTFLCIAADDSEDSSGRNGATSSGEDLLSGESVDVDFSMAHLQLCLKLQLPLVVVVTKLDIASKIGLSSVYRKVWGALKDANRTPLALSKGMDEMMSEEDLQTIPQVDETIIFEYLPYLQNHPKQYVPVIMTSAVNGRGIGKVHALLRHLPVPDLDSIFPGPVPVTTTLRYQSSMTALFHIDEIYSMSASKTSSFELGPDYFTSGEHDGTTGSILCGYVRYGELRVGDEFWVGPITVDVGDDHRISHSRSSKLSHRSTSYSNVQSKSLPSGVIHDEDETKPLAREIARSASHSSVNAFASNGASETETKGEWQRVRILSLRNLRLPVRRLLAGQVGTVGVMSISLPSSEGSQQLLSTSSTTATQRSHPRIRKGMVLASCTPSNTHPASYTGFTASFDVRDIPNLVIGHIVIVYIASMRASARIIEIDTASSDLGTEDGSTGVFDMDDGDHETHSKDRITNDRGDGEVKFKFQGQREWVELDSKVLVMLTGGGTKAKGALEGWVGRVMEVNE
ncbi:MAG: hypothetical protein M1834_003743 [Cirrosporium novae-zelandiae]|nr:MAG: hypothetical protein M1834_003743 [Cirrosporium novae-zelandiae]